MNTNDELFSIAVVTFQQRHLLEDCLDSIFEQDYPNIELIVCDDESCDFDVEDVKNYIDEKKQENIKNVIVYKQPLNVGTTANCQKAFELSGGIYFKLQAGDDMLREKDVLTKMAVHFKTSSARIIATYAQACTYEGVLLQAFYPPGDNFMKAVNASPAQLFEYIGTQPWGAFVCAPAVFWRRELLEEMGGFDLSYKFTEDWPMWLRLCQKGIKIHYVGEVTTIYRYGGISNNQSDLNKTLGRAHYLECIRLLKEISWPKLQKEHSLFSRLRCWHSIKSIESRIINEAYWSNWNFCQKAAWKIKNSPFFILSNLFHIRVAGIKVNKKPAIVLTFLFLFLFYFEVPMVGLPFSQYIWAFCFFVSLLCLFLMLGCQFLYLIFSMILNFRLFIRRGHHD